MTSDSSAEISSSLPVAVDVMGADYGPGIIVRGAVLAAREFNYPVILVGDETEIRRALNEFEDASQLPISVVHASEVITMDDKPVRAVRSKCDASICVAYQLVKDKKAIAVVSPGNTGAMMAAGLFILGTLPGITRPAIASLIPNVDSSPTVLLDSGANTDCSAEQLVQSAFMGHFYARAMLNKEHPRVALLSNGTEKFKGTDRIRAAAMMLSDLQDINYVGYIEGREIATAAADVVVCDGFVGNVVLKTMEGSVELVFDSIKAYASQSLRARLGMWLARPMFKALFRDKLDKAAYGGAPLLGLSDIGIVCHGSSDERAIKNAIRTARTLYDAGLCDRIRQMVAILDSRPGSFEDGMWSRIENHFTGKKKGDTGEESREKSREDTAVEEIISTENQSRNRK